MKNRVLVAILLLGLLGSLAVGTVGLAAGADPEPSPQPSDEQRQKQTPGDEKPTCELILRGEVVETLELRRHQRIPGTDGAVFKNDYRFSSPGKVLKLPPGIYVLERLVLKNGLGWYRDTSLSFDLTPEKPYTLASEGFSCKVIAERIGPFLNFDFKGPLDNEGRTYLDVNRSEPKYSVLCQGKEIASGTLEYG